MTRPVISSISPFFIVSDMASTLSFYRDRLGFAVTFQQPAPNDFFAIVRRDGAMIMFKALGVICDRPRQERLHGRDRKKHGSVWIRR